MSVTSTVPAAVPSLFQSSGPFVLKARKKSVPFTFVSPSGPEPPLPGLMSLTSTVPAAVPSLFQSSVPFAGSKPRKKSVPFTFVSPNGRESAPPVGSKAFTSTVPSAVPSLFQSSKAFVGSSATKKSVPFTAVRGIDGREEERPVRARQVGRVGEAAVLDEHRPLLRPVALPELGAVRGEEERPVHVRQLIRPGAAAAGVDVLHKRRSRRRPV